MTWSRMMRLHELARGPVTLDLEPDAGQRADIGRRLGLKSLPSLKARVVVRPWMDGAELSGRLDATVEQVCGVSLDPFEQPVSGDFEVRVVPPESLHAAPGEGGDLELDPEAPDAPDVLDGDMFDVAAYVVEHLGLELDPFPRKPGATFDYVAPEAETSPFSVLKKLTEPKA